MRHAETDYLVPNFMKMLDPGPRSVSLFTKLHHAGTYKLTLSVKKFVFVSYLGSMEENYVLR